MQVRHNSPPAAALAAAASVASLTSAMPSASTCRLKASATGSRPLGMRLNRRYMRARSSFCGAGKGTGTAVRMTAD
jgi:hypothetical protein